MTNNPGIFLQGVRMTLNIDMTRFHEDILSGIPAVLPEPKPYDTSVSHAPKRKDILSNEEKVLAIMRKVGILEG